MKKPRKRITKQELKEDEFVTFTSNVINFVLENKTYVMYGLGILVIIFLAILTGVFMSGRYDISAVELFSKGLQEYHVASADGQPAPPSIEQSKKAGFFFNDAFRKYPRSSVAPQAAYYYGLTQLKQNEINEAIRTFEYFIDKWPKNALAPEITVLLGVSNLGSKNYSKALEYFQQVPNNFSSSPSVSYAILQEGICYMKLENLQAARETFQRIIDEYSGSPWTEEAKDYLMLLPDAVEEVEEPELPATTEDLTVVEEEANPESEVPAPTDTNTGPDEDNAETASSDTEKAGASEEKPE